MTVSLLPFFFSLQREGKENTQVYTYRNVRFFFSRPFRFDPCPCREDYKLTDKLIVELAGIWRYTCLG